MFVKNTSESTLLVQLLLPFLTKFPIKYKVSIDSYFSIIDYGLSMLPSLFLYAEI